MQNHRKRIRVHLDGKIRISSCEESSDTLQIYNISHNGIALKGYFPVPEGTKCNLELMLPGEETTVLKMHGITVRNCDEKLAIKFSAVEHDSFDHLHNLIMYNSEDPQAIEFEFDFPGFEKAVV